MTAAPSPKVILVTGGNNGISYETFKALLQSDKAYHVLLGSRSPEKAKHAIETLNKECPESTNTVKAVQIDLTSDELIQKAFEQVKASPGHIDTLINNAAVSFDPEFVAGRLSLRTCFTKAYNVTVAGTQVMSWTLMPLLLKSADPPDLRGWALPLDACKRGLLSHPASADRVAQEDRLRDVCIPL